MYDTDVLIVGAGPTGLALALELALQSVSFRIVERSAARSDKSRALVVQPRTLELLNRHGDAGSQLVSKGMKATGAVIYVNKRQVADINLTDFGFTSTAFPQPLIISQAETEHFLEGRLEAYGHQIEKSVSAKEIHQDDGRASVTIEREDGSLETIHAKYIVGADGAHSIVRHSSNMKFEGEAYPQDFILADVHLDWEGVQDRAVACLGRGLMIILPLKDGLVRLVASRAGVVEEANPTLEDFQEFFSEMAPGQGRLYDPTWLARFKLHHRGVNTYRDGRLFVAGDAGHVHSPAGGQGMNTGIQDAINLGWKLARVIRGQEPDTFLDTYHNERWPVGQRLLRGTDQIFSFGASTNRFFIFMRNLLLPWLLPWYTGSAERRAGLFLFMSEFDIHYRGSAIVDTAPGFDGPVKGGDRAPDGKVLMEDGKEVWLMSLCHGPSHHLILFSGIDAKAADLHELRAAETRFQNVNHDGAVSYLISGTSARSGSSYVDPTGKMHGLYGFEQSGYVYVRPDGYVEHIGLLKDFNTLLQWLAK